MIPPFDEHGNLPPGIHWATWDELAERFGTGERRIQLLQGLASAVRLLRSVGCETVYVNGSFVTSRAAPEDVDVVWDAQGVDFLSIDPIFFVRGPQRNQQQERFNCELFSSDIAEASTGLPFIEYFQITDEGRAKGIIAIDLRRLP